MAHVFISYDHDDKDFAADLMNRLQAAGLTVWKDSASLRAGDDWRAQIDSGIKTAAAVVVVMTPNAADSDYVTFEWACALGAGVKLIPLLVRPTQLHARLSAIHYLDFTSPETAPWETLIKQLQALQAPVEAPVDVPPVVRKAVEALDGMDEEERTKAINLLGELDHPAARNALAGAVHHYNRDVRIKAALQLSRFKDARAVPGLIDSQRYWQLRWEFVRCVTRIGAAAVPDLLQALTDEDAEVREYTAHALGQIGEASAAPALRGLATDAVASVRDAAAKALEAIATRRGGASRA